RFWRRCYNGINTKALERFLIKEKFDCIITTHFMSAEVGAYLKRKGLINAKIICTVTDYDVHRVWINKGIDLYTAACDFTKEKIISLKVPADKVFVTGIPTDEKFSSVVDRTAARQQLKVDTKAFTVLLATGSFGTGPIAELMDMLSGYQLLVVCGSNHLLYERLKSRNNERVHVFGLVNNMYELMSAADVLVSKPGGLSISEALVKKLPMIFFNAIPGQETGNIKVLVKYQAAEDQGSLMDIVHRIDDLSSSPEKYHALRQKLEILSKPNAVKDIIQLI
ncbi:MAG: glycosyltransferase, partial [Candidatus Omnitrophota bacterium]